MKQQRSETDQSRWSEQAAMLANRLTKNARHRRKWARRTGVSCYRLYDRDIPELPIAIDWYEGRLHAALFAKPELGRDWLSFVVSAGADALGVSDSDVYSKVRERQRGVRQYEKQGDSSARIAVSEGGLKFWVNLEDYLDTGLFLDHRLTRAWVKDRSGGHKVLNLFCYTGSFSVYALAGGASVVTSVDLSNTYLSWAEENVALNQLPRQRHRCVRGDALAFLEQTEETYDLIVVDPPTFSNSKKTERDFDLRRDQVELLSRALAVTRPSGRIVFSTNARRVVLDPSTLPGAEVEEITHRTVPEDFARRRPHRCWLITRASS